MAKFKPASPQQLREIRESVDAAVRELKKISWNVDKPKRGSAHLPNQPRVPDNAICKEYLKTDSVRRMILDWVKRGDGYSFVRFGRHLSQKFVFIEETKYPLVPAFRAFLIIHWAERKDGFPEFCYLAPSDIIAVWRQYLGVEAIIVAMALIAQWLRWLAVDSRYRMAPALQRSIAGLSPFNNPSV